MKIAVLTSGGVDSSVALKLLKDQGHEVTAFYLKIWLEDELAHLTDCPWEQDLQFVREICERENIPLQIIPMQKEYFDTVVNYTISEVKAGRTPNPDVMCNNNVKFGLFLDKISDQPFDKVASGHYSQITEINGRLHLKKAPDSIKDQSYFLANLKQDQLSRLIFPIGHLSKDEVRELAHQFDLPNKERKDSQGICFLGKFKYSDFLKHYLGEKPGKIIHQETGEELGTHNGAWFFTVGQRKGIGIGGIKGSDGQPFYVVKKDNENNIVYVSNNYHAEENSRNQLQVTDFNWFSGLPPESSSLTVKLRHGPDSHSCTFQLNDDGKTATVKLAQDDQGIAKGQFAVFFEGSTCLGSAVIC